MTRAVAFPAAILAASLFCASAVSAQTKSKKDRDKANEERKTREAIDREIRDECAKFRRAYENAKAVYEGRLRRGASDELMEEAKADLIEAGKAYYACLLNEYIHERGMPLPREYERLYYDLHKLGAFPAPWEANSRANPLGLPPECEKLWKERAGKPDDDESRAAFALTLCDCLEKHAPELWRQWCQPRPDGSEPPKSGAGLDLPAMNPASPDPTPPAPPVPPEAPGTGRVGGGRARVPTPTPPPAVVPPPAPTPVSLALCAPEGASSDVTATVVRHLDNHDHTWCGQYLNRRIRALFTQVLASSLLLTLQGLPSPLTCSISPPGCAGTCETTFAQLAGQTNVTVRLELTLRNGQVQQGRLVFGFPGQPFEVALALAN